MSDQYHLWTTDHPFSLESGEELQPLQLAYHSWGELNRERDNVILVVPALTGNSNAKEWWGPVIGPGKPLDTGEYYVICISNLGSPYGSTSPVTFRDSGRDPTDFPEVTVRDIVRAEHLLLEELGVERLQTVIGGSLGGMVSLEWPLMFPEQVSSMVTIGSSPRHSAWCIGISALQREAIISDPAWQDGQYGEEQPRQGLGLARKIAMVSYRSQTSFQQRFGRNLQNGQKDYYAVESYLDYQGDKLVDRFDANCYLVLTEIMDTHDVGRQRDSCVEALRCIDVPSLVVGIDSDVLYPTHEQQAIADPIPNSEYYEITSENGHDAFLIEFDQVAEALNSFRRQYWEQPRENPEVQE